MKPTAIDVRYRVYIGPERFDNGKDTSYDFYDKLARIIMCAIITIMTVIITIMVLICCYC